MVASNYTADELHRFREVQKLAYDSAVHVAERLKPGITEKEAARMLGQTLHDRGVRAYFHQPFAWFGDRAGFAGFRNPLDFFPSDRRLEAGMSAILDVAPIVDGYAADIGYAFSAGPNEAVAQALRDLEGFRGLVLERVQAGDTMAQIYGRVDELLADLGYRNCHRKYPFGVLAHRVYRQPRLRITGQPVLGFGLSATAGFLAQVAAQRLPIFRQRSPFINDGYGSDEPPEAGLWAVEPHMRKGDVGVKWEELLVIDESEAYWLDDDLPHVQRWREQRQVAAEA